MNWNEWLKDYDKYRILSTIEEIESYLKFHKLEINDCSEAYIEWYIAVYERAEELEII